MASFFRHEGRLAQVKAAGQLAFIQESLMLMRLVKVYLMEPLNQTRVERQFASYARAQIQRIPGRGPLSALVPVPGIAGEHDPLARGRLQWSCMAISAQPAS